MPCYLVVAYRWGWTNNHQYFVGCWTNKDTAIAFAVKEREDRAGKYGCTVYEFYGAEEREEFIVHHEPSSNGEQRPRSNDRIALFERFGNQFVPIIEGESTGDCSKESMKTFIKKERAILEAISKAKSESPS